VGSGPWAVPFGRTPDVDARAPVPQKLLATNQAISAPLLQNLFQQGGAMPQTLLTTVNTSSAQEQCRSGSSGRSDTALQGGRHCCTPDLALSVPKPLGLAGTTSACSTGVLKELRLAFESRQWIHMVNSNFYMGR
jgi:hypothetical protein